MFTVFQEPQSLFAGDKLMNSLQALGSVLDVSLHKIRNSQELSKA